MGPLARMMFLFGWAIVLPEFWWVVPLCLGAGIPNWGSDSSSVSLPHGDTVRSALPLFELLFLVWVDNGSISLTSTSWQWRGLVELHSRGVFWLLLTACNLVLQSPCVPLVKPERKKWEDQSCLSCHKMDDIGNEIFVKNIKTQNGCW